MNRSEISDLACDKFNENALVHGQVKSHAIQQGKTADLLLVAYQIGRDELTDDLVHILRATATEISQYVPAGCWCENAAGNPNFPRHTDRCKMLQRAWEKYRRRGKEE